MNDNSPEPSEQVALWRKVFAYLFTPEGGPPVHVKLHFCYAPHLASFAERIVDRLKDHFKDLQVTIAAAADARSAVQSADLVFIAIDKNCHESLQLDRLDGEIPCQLELALARTGTWVVPLLVGTAEMPSAEQLGTRLALLANRNAVTVDPGRAFDDDVNLLVHGIKSYYRNVPLRMATSRSRAGLLARFARFLDRVFPISFPPSFYRDAPYLYAGVFLGMELFWAAGVVLAITRGDTCIAFGFGGFFLFFGRIAVPVLLEAFSRPFFEGKPEVFLSYRRVDTLGMPGRIYDHLQQHFGWQTVFMDVEGCIPIGVDFHTYLPRQMSSSRLIVIMVGADWTGGRERGQPRIFDDGDFVRIEVEYALRSGKPVVVVLLDRPSFPEGELPDSIQPITKLPVIVVRSGSSFEEDMRLLAVCLHGHLKALRPSLLELWMQPSEDELDSPWWHRALKYGALMLIGIGFLALIYSSKWVDDSLGQHIGAGFFAALVGVPVVVALGKLIGAFRDAYSGRPDQPKQADQQDGGEAKDT